MDDFEDLYKRYYNQVYFYILGLSRNKHIAEEITQETFFKVLNKIDSFKGECRINVWITQIAKNTYYNYCRKRKLDPESNTYGIGVEGLETEENIEKDLIDKEMAQQIHVILHQLSEPYKEVFWMRTFGELPFREIADIHGKTESWARVTYHRARLMIREEMQKD